LHFSPPGVSSALANSRRACVRRRASGLGVLDAAILRGRASCRYEKASTAQHAKPRSKQAAAVGVQLSARRRAEIAGIEGRRPDARRRTHARRLFAKALDTPGGRKCRPSTRSARRLLHQFPFEAGVRCALEGWRAHPIGTIGRLRRACCPRPPRSGQRRSPCAWDRITMAADQTFSEVIGEAIGNATRSSLIKRTGSVAVGWPSCGALLGVDPTKRWKKSTRISSDGPILLSVSGGELQHFAAVGS